MSLVVAILFIVMGCLIKYGKMYDLIAGYNTMSKEKKQQYNIEGIATVFRNVMFAMAFVLIIGYLVSYWFESKRYEAVIIIITLLLGLPYLLIVSNSKKYKINTENERDSSHKI